MKRVAEERNIAIAGVFCNRPQARVVQRAHRRNVPVLVFGKAHLEEEWVLSMLRFLKVDVIVLLGFLWKIPAPILEAFPSRVVNLHPSLLPDFGGAGMYGMRVHEAVVAQGCRESGITLHLADAEYDRGPVLLQKRIALDPGESPESLAAKIHALEQAEVPEALVAFISSLDA